MRSQARSICPNCSTNSKRLIFRIFAAAIPLLYLSMSAPASQAIGDDHSKAVRRTSSESGASIKDQRRIALVIGNKDYKDAPLRNPVNDAEDISGVLQGLGFAVQTRINVNHRQMDEAVKEFVQKIQNGDVALFYFSGHGAQVKGENYLLPVGVSIESESDAHYNSVPVGLILEKLEESRNKINIVILDACRNNPFKGFRSANKGLSHIDAPVGTFIAYATAPGSVAADGTGRNSPYTKHLLQALKMEDIKIDDAFRQVLRGVRGETEGKQNPWISSCLPDEFYFNPSSRTSSSTKPSGGGKTDSEQEVARLREAERVAALERERLEEARREHEQEIAKLRDAERVAAVEKERLERERLDREKREREQELAKLREAQRVAALEKGNWIVVLGSFPKIQSNEAQKRADFIRQAGYDASVVDTDNYPKLAPGLWAVVLGPYSRNQAMDVRKRTRTIVSDAYVKEWK